MKKIKTIDAFEESLLDGKGDKRDHKKDDTGKNVVEKPPDFASDDKNAWIKDREFTGRLKGWEKLSIEGYYCGWLDYFDTEVEPITDPKKERLIYFKWGISKDDGKSGGKATTLTIYTTGSTSVAQPKDIQTSLPKPPPPSG